MGQETRPKRCQEVDYTCLRREVMAWTMDMEGCTIDMDFGMKKTRANKVTTVK